MWNRVIKLMLDTGLDLQEEVLLRLSDLLIQGVYIKRSRSGSCWTSRTARTELKLSGGSSITGLGSRGRLKSEL